MQPSSRIRFHLFGELTIFPGDAPDQPLSIPSRKARALLAYLATQREARREQLAKLLWADRFDKQARQSLRQSLIALRRQLEPLAPGLLVLDGEMVALDAESFSTDAREFETLAEKAGDPERALALYRGEFLAGFSLDVQPFDAWVTEERARLAAIAVRLLQAQAAPKATAAPIAPTDRACTTEAPRPGHKNPIPLALRDANGEDAASAPSAPERSAGVPLEAEGRFEPSAAASGWRSQIPNVWLLALACVAVLAITASRFWLLAPDRSVSALPDPQGPGRTFKDCDICPEMVELPAGEFMMGSPQQERGREAIEGSQRRVVIAKRFALSRFEVTVDQLSAFIAETGTSIGDKCHSLDPDTGRLEPPHHSFHQPGFEFTGSHPAVCVSWHEAQAYVEWLGRRTGKAYRLPSEAEWEYAARAGTTTRFSFGDKETELCHYARFADLASSFLSRGACLGATTTHGPLLAGALKPNPWGLFDMHGNVWEWAADCWTPDTLETPVDGSAFKRPGHCLVGVIRGGGWTSPHARLRSAMRLSWAKNLHYQAIGLRVALSLEPP